MTERWPCTEMVTADHLQIEVVGFHRVWTVSLPEGSTVRDAVQESGAIPLCPEFSWDRVGVYGQICSPDTLLRHGDQVELYRPLSKQPRQARRLRAMRQKKSDG